LILGGDIGGTKCNLAVFQETEGPSLHPVFQRRYATRDFSTFEDLITHFLRQGAKTTTGGQQISAAGFGVAGAVVEGQLHANNLPWTLNLSALAQRLDVSLENIVLLNDMVATAWSLDQLPANDLAVLTVEFRNRMQPGRWWLWATGLGEAFLVWDGPTESRVPFRGRFSRLCASHGSRNSASHILK